MKYVMLITGYGQGCDYTIGCNLTWEEGEAENWEEISRRAEQIAEDYGCGEISSGGYEEERIEKIEILHVMDKRVWDLDGYKARKRATERALEDQEKEKEEREMLAKLKEKYE